jgi:putative membrane protein insertion efficiency factor
MNRLATRVLIGLVHAYRITLGPLFGGSCRFTPSCSSYALEALARHGAVRGTHLGLSRILRCHPFHPAGHDPVPHGDPR